MGGARCLSLIGRFKSGKDRSRELEAAVYLEQRSEIIWLRFLKDYCYTELQSLLKTHTHIQQRTSLTGLETR